MLTSAFFRGKLKNPSRYHSSKNERIRDRVDPRVQFLWRLRVMGFCLYLFIWQACDLAMIILVLTFILVIIFVLLHTSV